VGDLVVGDVEDAEVGVGGEGGGADGGEEVVRDVEFFEGGEGGEGGDGGEAVGLNGEDFEGGEGGEVLCEGVRRDGGWLRLRGGWRGVKDLKLGDLVLAEPEFFEGCKRFQVLNFLAKALMTTTCICRGYEHWAYTYLVCSKLQVSELVQAFQAFDLGDLILNEVNVGELLEMVDILDVLDIVEAQVQTCKLPERFETFDM